MEASEMYSRTVENLRRAIDHYTTPTGRTGQRAFAEAHGVNRANLQQVLSGVQEVSVGLFMRLAAALDGKPAPELPPGVERWSLRTWLEMQSVPIHAAMYTVNFAEQGKVQKSKKDQNLP